MTDPPQKPEPVKPEVSGAGPVAESKPEPSVIVQGDRGLAAIVFLPRLATQAHIRDGLWWPSVVIFAMPVVVTSLAIKVMDLLMLGPRWFDLTTLAGSVGRLLIAMGVAIGYGLLQAVTSRWIGRLFGGTGKTPELFIASGVAFVPFILLVLAMWIVFAVFEDARTVIPTTSALSILTQVWAAWRLARCVSVAHGFGFWRGLATMALGYALVRLLWWASNMVFPFWWFAPVSWLATGESLAPAGPS